MVCSFFEICANAVMNRAIHFFVWYWQRYNVWFLFRNKTTVVREVETEV